VTCACLLDNLQSTTSSCGQAHQLRVPLPHRPLPTHMMRAVLWYMSAMQSNRRCRCTPWPRTCRVHACRGSTSGPVARQHMCTHVQSSDRQSACATLDAAGSYILEMQTSSLGPAFWHMHRTIYVRARKDSCILRSYQQQACCAAWASLADPICPGPADPICAWSNNGRPY